MANKMGKLHVTRDENCKRKGEKEKREKLGKTDRKEAREITERERDFY